MANKSKALFEEMRDILLMDSRSFTPEELAEEINEAGVYVRSNGMPVTKSQIMAAVRKYRLLFTYNGTHIHLAC